MLIEVIGIPGSGKSTLIKELKNDSFVAKNFKTWNEVKMPVVRSYMERERIRAGQLTVFPRNILWKIPVFNYFLADYCFQKIVKFSTLAYSEYWGQLAAAIIQNIVRRKDLPKEAMPYYINLELDKVVRSNLLKSYSAEKGINVMLDEGLITAANTLPFNLALLHKKMLPNAVLFLNTSPENSALGVMKRRQEGRINVSQKNKTDEEVLEYITVKHSRYLEMIKYLRKCGVTVVRYNRETDSLASVVDQLKQTAKRS